MELPAIVQIFIPIVGYAVGYGITTLMVGTAYGQNRRPAKIAGWIGVAIGCVVILFLP